MLLFAGAAAAAAVVRGDVDVWSGVTDRMIARDETRGREEGTKIGTARRWVPRMEGARRSSDARMEPKTVGSINVGMQVLHCCW